MHRSDYDFVVLFFFVKFRDELYVILFAFYHHVTELRNLDIGESYNCLLI